MAPSVNRVTLVGTVAFEPTFNYYPIKKGRNAGKDLNVCKARLAVDGYGADGVTTWFHLSILGCAADARKDEWSSAGIRAFEYALENLEKGARVYVEGVMHNYSYTDRFGSQKYGFEVMVKKLLRVDDKQPVRLPPDPDPDVWHDDKRVALDPLPPESDPLQVLEDSEGGGGFEDDEIPF